MISMSAIPSTQSSNSRNWRGMALPSFLVQQLVSTAGAMVVGTLAGFIPAVLVSAVTKNTSGGNWVDHIADQPLLRVVGEPYFAFPVIAGFLLGVLSHRFFRSSSAAWVWVLPTIILVWNLFTWRNGGYRAYWPDVWDNYFGSHCGSSECLYEVFVTAPFYTSLAYTLGWIARRTMTLFKALPAKSA
jgi:hypothetical protein